MEMKKIKNVYFQAQVFGIIFEKKKSKRRKMLIDGNEKNEKCLISNMQVFGIIIEMKKKRKGDKW